MELQPWAIVPPRCLSLPRGVLATHPLPIRPRSERSLAEQLDRQALLQLYFGEIDRRLYQRLGRVEDAARGDGQLSGR